MLTNGELQRQKFDMMARQQESLIKSTEKRLDDMRTMVEEKLQKTLNERIGQSFEIVRSQLENVQKGLGEMKSLAQDVGGLKKVLSNVKMRGTFGEVQLGALLEQMMSPEQYDANVKPRKAEPNSLSLQSNFRERMMRTAPSICLSTLNFPKMYTNNIMMLLKQEILH